MSKPVWNAQQFDDYLNRTFWESYIGSEERQWAGNNPNITYSISNEYAAHDAQGIRDAFDAWADVANIRFQQVGSNADIRIVEGDGALTAFSSYPIYLNNGNIVSDGTFANGQTFEHYISVNLYHDNGGTTPRTVGPTYGTDMSEYGNYAKSTIIHEIGHSIGLGHSGPYNNSATYAANAIGANDTTQYSIMSYFDETNYGGANFLGSQASTPMLMDIYAIQQKYGANMNTRTGNSIYGFNANTGGAYDFTSHDGVPVVSIWDAGGNDTLDFSGYSNNQLLNLNEGAFSNAGGGTGNVSIAFGAVIENAIGGSGNDIFYGNNANNILSGGLGNDTLNGSAGSDTLDGEAGVNDQVIYNYNIGQFLVSLVNSFTVTLQHITELWTDTVRNVENFVFNDGTQTFAQLEATFAPEEIIMRAYFGDQNYRHTSTENGTTTISGLDLGYGANPGNIYRVERTDGDSMVVTVLNSSSPGDLRFWSNDEGVDIRVQGSKTNLSVTFYGKAADDTFVVSTGGNDALYGRDGNDTLSGGGGNDKIYGDEGVDTLNGDAGNDMLNGGIGNDILNGGTGDDLIYGADGDDVIRGNHDNDTLRGQAGDDDIYGGQGRDFLYGNDGEDELWGDADTDSLYGGNNNDTLYGGAGNDVLYGENGDDILYGNNDNDTIYGGNNNDQLYGGAGVDRLFGNSGNDTLVGGDGNDQLFGGTGTNILRGGAGNDALRGEDGIDTADYSEAAAGVFVHLRFNKAYNDGDGGQDFLKNIENATGSNFDDTLRGSAEANVLNGGDGNDNIYAHNGDDTLIGGAGRDILFGEGGNDTFVLDVLDGNIDQIRDFDIAGEVIDISNILSGYSGSNINLFVELDVLHGNRTDIRINADGQGSDFQTAVIVWGSDFSGLSAQNLVDDGNLIA